MKNINSLGQKIIPTDNQEQLKRFWRWFEDSKVVDDQGDPLVVFHGSKTQFHTFDNSVNQDKERQMGAEFGFFFTDDITVARRFLNPNVSVNEYMQLRNDVFKNKDNFDAAQDINSYIKNLEFEKKYGGMSDADYEYCIKEVQDNINELCSLTGKDWNEMIEAIDLLCKMEQNIRDEQEENDKTLYQCYLKIENPKYYSGEIIGVGPERELALQSAFGSGYDGVIIYNADTGAGIANEYVVFDSTQIKSVQNSGYFNPTSKNIFESVNSITTLQENYDETPYYLKQYIKSGERYLLSGHEKELLDMYPLKKSLVVYRGLNFNTEEDYKEFLKQVDLKNKIYLNPSISSWTTFLDEAISFAMTPKKYTEYFSLEDIKSISKQEKEYERLAGYNGIVLEIEVQPNQAIDIQDISVENEILVPKGKYKLINYKLIDNFTNIFANIKTEDECLDVLKTLSDKNFSEFTKAVKWLNKNKRELLTDNILHYILSQNEDLIYYISDVSDKIKHEVFLKIMNDIKNANEKYKVEFHNSSYSASFEKNIRVFVVSPNYYLKWILPNDAKIYFNYIKPYVKKIIDEVAEIYEKYIDDYLNISWDNKYMKTILIGTGLYEYYQQKIGSLLKRNYNDSTRGMKKPSIMDDIKKVSNRVKNIINSMNIGESQTYIINDDLKQLYENAGVDNIS